MIVRHPTDNRFYIEYVDEPLEFVHSSKKTLYRFRSRWYNFRRSKFYRSSYIILRSIFIALRWIIVMVIWPVIRFSVKASFAICVGAIALAIKIFNAILDDEEEYCIKVKKR